VKSDKLNRTATITYHFSPLTYSEVKKI